MELFRALTGRRSCNSHLALTLWQVGPHHGTRQTNNIGLAPREGFQRTDVNYNFRRCSAKARLMLCMTQNQGWLISLSSGCGDGTFFSARGI
jgi:hypothetical protein